MSGGYRLFVLAVGLILCGAQAPQEHSDSKEGTRRVAPALKIQATTVPIVTTEPSPSFTAYPDYDPDPCYRAKDHNAADLCAQWRSAIAAEKATIETRRSGNWSIVATILSALSLGAVAIALGLTLRNNYIIYQSERAFLYLEPKIPKSGSSVQVKVRNRGRTPANILGCFFDDSAALPPEKIGLQKAGWRPFSPSMPMEIAPPDEVTIAGVKEQPTCIFRVEVLYMTTFNRKCRTIGFYEAKGRSWILKQNTGWLHMT